MRDEQHLIGNSIGNYLVVDHLARGGFGDVYLGRHTLLATRMVAIKLLHGKHLTSQREYERFLQEAQHLEQLKHPYIVPLLDAGLHDSIPYIVTAYLPHGSLEDRLARQRPAPLPVEESMRILSQIGQALHAVHEHHIIHRDLKPANILFNARGDALLADFGIAVALAGASIEQTATFLGTVAYMAPEQIQGLISTAGDQYALACLAYQLLTGHLPFRASELVALMYQQVHEPPPDPRGLNPHLPLHIGQALLKAMAKERSARYPDVATFLAALQIPPFNVSQPLLPLRRLLQAERSGRAYLDEPTLELPCVRADQAEILRHVAQSTPSLQTALDALLDGVITTDATGIITTCNAAAGTLLRLSPQAVLGKHYREVLRIRPYTDLARLLDDALAQPWNKTRVSSEVDWSLREELVALRCSVTVLDASEKHDGLMVVIEDRADHKRLQEQAQELRSLLELYASANVVDQVVRHPSPQQLGGATQELSVLVAALRHVGKPGEQLMRLLNASLEVVAPAICQERGIVTGLSGERLIVIFTAPLWQPDHALRAVRAAWKMRGALLASHQAHREGLPVTFGMGVNTGLTMVGNLEAQGLLQNYTAVRETVNVAACLQAQAPDNAILLHHATFTRVRRAVTVDLLVKDKAKPIDAWLLQGVVGV